MTDSTLRTLSTSELGSAVAMCILRLRGSAFQEWARALLGGAIFAQFAIAGPRAFPALVLAYVIYRCISRVVLRKAESRLDVLTAKFVHGPNAVARAVARIAGLNGLPRKWPC